MKTQFHLSFSTLFITLPLIRVSTLTTVLGIGGSLVLLATHGWKPPSSSLGSFVKFELPSAQILLSTQHMDLGTGFHDEIFIKFHSIDFKGVVVISNTPTC